MLEASVLQQFGKLQQVVRAVVHQDHQGAHLLGMFNVKLAEKENVKADNLFTLVKWAVQERAMRAMVVLWWMNISQKSFRCTSKNWLQRYHQSSPIITKISKFLNL